MSNFAIQSAARVTRLLNRYGDNAPSSGATFESVFDGVTGSVISTPTSEAGRVDNAIDIRVFLSMDDWTPSLQQVIVNKWGGAGFRSYQLLVKADGKLALSVSSTGTDAPTSTSATALGFANDTEHGIRFTWDTTTGTAKVFTRVDDDLNDLAGWTQVGPNINNATTSTFHSTKDVEIAKTAISFEGVLEDRLEGAVKRAQVREGIDGSPVLDFDVDDFVTGSTLTSSTTGEVWTFGGSTIPTPVGDPLFPAQIRIERLSGATIDRINKQRTGGTLLTVDLVGIVKNRRDEIVGGSRVKMEADTIHLNSAFEPISSDIMIINGDRFTIIDINTTNMGNVTIAFTVKIKK